MTRKDFDEDGVQAELEEDEKAHCDFVIDSLV